MKRRRVVATTLASSMCALAVIGGTQIQGASGSTQASADAHADLQGPVVLVQRAGGRPGVADDAGPEGLADRQQHLAGDPAASGSRPTGGGTRRCTASPSSRRPTTRNAGVPDRTRRRTRSTSRSARRSIPDLEYQISSNISDEAREVMPSNSENLDFYSPTMNIERDPRWGRNDESFGEDPLLESKLVSQFVDGMEGKDAERPAAGRRATASTRRSPRSSTTRPTTARSTGSTATPSMDARTLREFDTKPFGHVVAGRRIRARS